MSAPPTLVSSGPRPEGEKRPFIHASALIYAGAAIAVFAGMANEIIAQTAVRAFQIGADFEPLASGNVALATVLAALAATVALLVLDRATLHAERMFATSATALLLASFIPVIVLAQSPDAGASPAAIATLATTHFVAFVTIVPLLLRTARKSRR
jgi:hypothetical protein